MSVPNEPDFVLIKVGDGGGTEVFTIACGLQDVTVDLGVDTNDRMVRDCAKPGEIPVRRVKATGKKMDVSAKGFIDKAQLTAYHAALGKAKNYKIEYYVDDGTDAGTLWGTYSGAYMMDSVKQSIPRENQAGVDITLKNHGPWTWLAAA